MDHQILSNGVVWQSADAYLEKSAAVQKQLKGEGGKGQERTDLFLD